MCEADTGLLAGAGRRSPTHTLSNVSTSTFLGLLQGRGSLFSSTAKFSGGRALRDGFLRSTPTPDSNLRFRGVAFSLFFCRDLQNLVDNLLTIWPWQSKLAEQDGQTLRGFVYRPEGWKTSVGLWWYSNLQRAWPAKTQQQKQEVRWPLMPTGQIKQCKSVSGGVSHHSLVFLNVLVSFLKALTKAFLSELLFLISFFLRCLLHPPSPSASLGRGLWVFFQSFLLWSLFGSRHPFDRKPEERNLVDRHLIKIIFQLWMLFSPHYTHTQTQTHLRATKRLLLFDGEDSSSSE